jgi:hypothetical protein
MSVGLLFVVEDDVEPASLVFEDDITVGAVLVLNNVGDSTFLVDTVGELILSVSAIIIGESSSITIADLVV